MMVWGPWFSKLREKLTHRWRGEALIWSALSSRVTDDWMASLMLSFQAEDQLCLFFLSLPLCLVFLLLNHSSVFPLTCVFSLVNHFSIFISCDSPPPPLICCLFCNFWSFSQSPFPFPSLSHHHILSSNPKKEHTFFFVANSQYVYWPVCQIENSQATSMPMQWNSAAVVAQQGPCGA